MSKKEESPKGIGGWLILVIFGLVASPIRSAYFVLTNHLPIFKNGVWEAITTPGTDYYHVLWGPLIVFEIFGNLIFIALAIIALVQLFRRSRHTPKLVIIWLAWISVVMVIDYFAANWIPAVGAYNDPSSTKDLFRTLMNAAIWIPYFLVSKRVKATFVN